MYTKDGDLITVGEVPHPGIFIFVVEKMCERPRASRRYSRTNGA